jgi:hypothetical protein
MRATGIQETDDAAVALAKLRSLLARAVTDVEQALRYYGAVLSIPACSGYEPADFGSPSERERGFQVLVDALVAASRRRPVLVVVEDIQWMDPTTIELLVRVIAQCRGERIMVLITHREDYRADWLSGPAIRRIALQNWPCMKSSRWSQPSPAVIWYRAGLPARSWIEPTACHSLSRSLRGPSSIPARSRRLLRALCRAGNCRLWCRQVFKIH